MSDQRQPRDRFRNVPRDPMEWRPMVPLQARTPVTVTDPVIEPLWSGARTLLHYDLAREGDAVVVLTDMKGAKLEPSDPEVTTALEQAIFSRDAVVDGVLTLEASRGGEGASPITESTARVGSFMFGRDSGLDIRRRDGSEGTTLAFVAIDLLRIDGQSLLDVPLLERKRLLESVVVPSDRVRVTIHTRPPVDVWVASWKAAGLKGAMLKGANSRYVPGGYSEHWRTVTRIGQRR
jgi:ATP dependent DNA ligase domain